MAVETPGRGPLGRPRLDITGQRYGKLVAVCVSQVDHRQRTHWEGACDCGSTTVVRLSDLRRGTTQSCGCLRVEAGKRNRVHGGKGTRLYHIWRAMKGRCHNPNATGYERYGAKGIAVCDEWRSDFAAFQQWSFAHGYADDLTLDRVDNDRGYEPGNCRWVTWTVQENNKRGRRAA